MSIDKLCPYRRTLFECLSADPLIADTLGGHVFTHYTEGKRREWDEYRTRVTDWELKKYMLVY